MALDSPGVNQSKEIQQTLSALESAERHPFEFGFRHAVKIGKANFYLGKNGEWRFRVETPAIEDKVWHGNCAQDAVLTAQHLKKRTAKDVAVTIQKLDSKGMGNSPLTTDHYRVLVEHHQPPHSVIKNIDHSPFHKQYLTPLTQEVERWRDLSIKEESELEKSIEPICDQPARGFAYCEFDVSGTRGLSYISLIEEDNKGLKIVIDLIMPGLAKGKTNRSVSFPVYYHQLATKEKLIQMIENSPFFNPEVKTQKDKEELIPSELKPLIKTWFQELISVLPDSIKKS